MGPGTARERAHGCPCGYRRIAMQRLTITLLAALDALIAGAIGVAVAVTPLLLFWAIELHADWGALWPAAAAIWQSGHLVPIILHLPAEYLQAAGVSADAATFTLSVAPLGYAAAIAVFAARSGLRAAAAGAWLTGVIAGTAVYALIGALVWITSRNPIAAVWGWQALLFPALVYGLPLLAGAVVAAWRDGDGGVIDRLHDRVDALAVAWSELPGLAGRGLAMLALTFVALGAGGVLVATILRGGDVIALFQAARVDVWGATLLTLAHLLFLPTLIVWAFGWIAGPGFSVGIGANVSAVGADVGVVPGLPLAGLLPQSGSVWWLAVALLPLAAAAVIAWRLRTQFVGVVGAREPFLPRLVLTLVLGIGSGAIVALCCALASGSIGPGRLAQVGPDPIAVGTAVMVEVLIGAAIVLLTPRAEEDHALLPYRGAGLADDEDGTPADPAAARDDQETAPLGRLGRD